MEEAENVDGVSFHHEGAHSSFFEMGDAQARTNIISAGASAREGAQ
jgi:hypothetical protein